MCCGLNRFLVLMKLMRLGVLGVVEIRDTAIGGGVGVMAKTKTVCVGFYQTYSQSDFTVLQRHIINLIEIISV